MTLIMIMQLSRYRSGGQDLAFNAHLSKLDELNPIKNAIINVKCRFSVWLLKLVPEEMTRDEVDVWNINDMMGFISKVVFGLFLFITKHKHRP